MKMKQGFVMLCGYAVFQVVASTVPPEITQSHTLAFNRGQGYGLNEDVAVEARSRHRQIAFTALERPSGSRCAEGRQPFLSGLHEYYYHRQNQTERYAENFGRPGANYIAQQWSTADDQRIDRLTQDAYAKGYLKPSDFGKLVRSTITNVVKDERVTGNACAS
jgi:hypothetical protein